MTPYHLIIGNRNTSSWSFRAWLAMRQSGAAFGETLVALDSLGGHFELARLSPTRKVPVLRHGSLVIPESLAIVEYMSEQMPNAGLWPAQTDARAVARAMCAEMHSGFAALRTEMPMDISGPNRTVKNGPALRADIARILSSWREARGRFGNGGPYLFGAWSAADAFFAPVVFRFATYGVTLHDEAEAYCRAVRDWPPVAEWVTKAQREAAQVTEPAVSDP